jgi:type IX secretion system PorP/SprF family membrane protein
LKRSVFILLFLFLSFAALFAQQMPHYSQYMNNGVVLNPAVTGSESCIMMGVNVRKQWLGFEKSPFTQTAFAHAAFGKKNGLGILIMNDAAGAEHFSGAELSYAFFAKKTRDEIFSLGISAKVMQYVFDQTWFETDLPVDPSLSYSKTNNIQPDVAAGVYYKNKVFYWGIGAQQLLSSSIKLTSFSFLKRHYFLTAGYKYNLNRSTVVEPSFLIKSMENLTTSIDLNIKAVFDKKFLLGLSYRNTDALVGFFGLMTNKFNITYTYDLITSKIFKHSSGSHEIFIGYKICRGKGKGEPFKRIVPCPAYQ